MSDVTRVTVAPRCFVTITPHPAGVAVLRSLTLGEGNTVDVTPARAAALLRAGLILDPVTGALPPAPEPMRENEMTVTINGGPPRSANGGTIAVEPATEVEIVPSSTPSPLPPGNHSHGLMSHPSVIYSAGHHDEMATIVNADGRIWPSY